MIVKSKCILLYANPYSIKDEDTGQINTGVSLRYILNDNIQPVENGDEKGYKTAKGSLPLEHNKKIKSVPAVYEMDFEMKINAQGQTNMKLVNLDYFAECFAPPQPPAKN